MFNSPRFNVIENNARVYYTYTFISMAITISGAVYTKKYLKKKEIIFDNILKNIKWHYNTCPYFIYFFGKPA